MNKVQKNHIIYWIVAIMILFSQSAAIIPAQPDMMTEQTGSVEIDDWWVHSWSLVKSPYSCHGDWQAGCWVSLDYHKQAWLLSQKSVFIDPAWKDPSLVFWTKYYSHRLVNFAYIEIQVEGESTWDRVKIFGGRRIYWHQVVVDLSAYSGKKILVKFVTEPHVVFVGDSESKGGKKFQNSNLFYNKQLFYLKDVSIHSEPPAP